MSRAGDEILLARQRVSMTVIEDDAAAGVERPFSALAAWQSDADSRRRCRIEQQTATNHLTVFEFDQAAGHRAGRRGTEYFVGVRVRQFDEVFRILRGRIEDDAPRNALAPRQIDEIAFHSELDKGIVRRAGHEAQTRNRLETRVGNAMPHEPEMLWPT